MIEPKEKNGEAMILELKFHNFRKEKILEDTVPVELTRIEEKQYETSPIAHGIAQERICKYGFALLAPLPGVRNAVNLRN